MTSEETIKAITSTDNQQAWLAGWEIIRATDNEISIYTQYLAEIDIAIKGLPTPDGTSIRDNRDIPKLALNIIKAVASNNCRCSVY